MSSSEAENTDIEVMESSAAPLIEHLVELRQRLIWIAAYIIVAFVVCFYFNEEIYIFLA